MMRIRVSYSQTVLATFLSLGDYFKILIFNHNDKLFLLHLHWNITNVAVMHQLNMTHQKEYFYGSRLACTMYAV